MSVRIWKSKKEFHNDFMDYIKECEEQEKLANVAGFCVWKGIHRDTYYAQQDYYSDTYKLHEEIFEDYALNHPMPPAVKIFYLKNKCNYRDSQEINSNVSVKSSVDELVQSIDKAKK